MDRWHAPRAHSFAAKVPSERGMGMQRREFVGLIGGAAAWPLAARAQQPGKIPVVGVLWHGSAEKEWSNPFYHYLHDDFAKLGYIAGKTVRFEERYANENQDKYDQLANELLTFNPDLLMGISLPAALAFKKATSRIPILFMGVPDPVGSGLVASIAKPGGNITGMGGVARETYLKRVQILKQLVPGLSRLALLVDLDVPAQVAFEQQYYASAAAANGVELEVFGARDKPGIDEAFPKMVQAKCDAAVISQQGIFFLLRAELSEAALSNRVPTMGPSEAFVPSGLLVAYSPVIKERFVSCVAYATRILRGEKPSDLPVHFATELSLAVNLKTAATLNLTIPPVVLTAADRVFE
jgi:putative ABC transport system substrate-binding protein